MSSSSTNRPSLTQVIVEINNLETILEQLKRMNEPEIVNQLIRKVNTQIKPYCPSSAARSFEIEPLEASPDESGLQVSNVIFKSAEKPVEEERTNRVGRRQSEKVKRFRKIRKQKNSNGTSMSPSFDVLNASEGYQGQDQKGDNNSLYSMRTNSENESSIQDQNNRTNVFISPVRSSNDPNAETPSRSYSSRITQQK